MMSPGSNAGSRRQEGGLVSALGNLTVGYQPRHSEHLASSTLHRHTDLLFANIYIYI